MTDPNYILDERIQKMVDMKISGLDIMHGELKNLMLEADNQLAMAQDAENQSGEAMDSMDRTYWEGQMDALSYLYSLTYQLSFAIMDKDQERK